MKAIAAVDYTPVQNWRSGVADENGEIHEMWYSDDWTQAMKKEFKPVPHPVYNPDKPIASSILVVKPYRSGSFYYPSVDYQGALQYSHIEEEISNFHLNNILNGFMASTLINFNNGDPGEEQQREIEKAINSKWGGSGSKSRIVVAFNDDKERAATVETLQSSDLDKQYSFLSEESTKKIMVGHRITSPLFFGIRDGAGLGSNADEIKNAWLLHERNVLTPYRELMINNFEYLLSQNDSFIPLEFISNTPIEFKEEDTEKQQLKAELSDDKDWLLNKGEDVDGEEWELIDERKVDYDLEEELDIRVDLAKVVSGNARAGSKQDNKLFKVRYSYEPKVTSENSRDFCTKMTKGKKVYRKEDIQFAENKVVNPGWGPKGAETYDIWLYKGGGDCHHYWMRKTYLRRNNKSISVNEAKKLIMALPPDERDEARLPTNDPKVAKRPTDMPNQGFLPTNKRRGKR